MQLFRNLIDRSLVLFSRIWIRLLLFNVLLVFFPIGGVLYLRVFETKLLEAQERSMVQQGRLLSAALSGAERLTAERTRKILSQLNLQTVARLRILNVEGVELADSSALGPLREAASEAGRSMTQSTVREDYVYRLGAAMYRRYRRAALWWASEPPLRVESREDATRLNGAISAALEGRYGAAWQVRPGQRAVNLHSLLPIWNGTEVVGVAWVSQSTLRLLEDLDEVRLAVFSVVLASLGVAGLVTILVSATIAVPLRKLQREALQMLDLRGRFQGPFAALSRRDEIGDLSRALGELSNRLEERIRFVESFAADMSHEFKNRLAALRNSTELLSIAKGAEQSERFLDMALTEIARMESLLQGVREISLIDAAVEDQTPEEFELAPFLENILEAYRLQLGDSARLELYGEAGILVRASPDRLQQAVENLLDNAISFSPKHEPVVVELTRKAELARLRIIDRGPGIPEEHLEQIFERFFSYRPDGFKPRSFSAGLGLPIARAIIEAYGGRLGASNGVDQGAVFEVLLPLWCR